MAAHGEAMEVDLKAGTARNPATGAAVPIEPISAYALSILYAGGIKPLMLSLEGGHSA